MKKFGRKSMLGFLTASAIVVTTVGSYAVWDQLEATKTGTLVLNNPTVVTATGDFNYNSDKNSARSFSDTFPEYVSDPVTFTATDVPKGTATTLELEATAVDSTTSQPLAGLEAVVVDENGAPVTGSKEDFAANANISKQYKVKVQATAGATDEQIEALKNKSVNVSLKGTLKAQTPTS